MAETKKFPIKAVATTFAATIGAMVGIYTLWQGIRKPDANLEAICYHYEWEQMPRPPISSFISDASQKEIDKFKESLEGESEIRLSSVELAMERAFDSFMGFGRLARAYFRVDVTNNGNLSARDVVLRVPDTAAVLIKYEDGHLGKDIRKFNESIIEIGNMPPRSTISVSIWAKHNPSRYGAEEIVLSHSTGTVDMDIHTPVRSLRYHISNPQTIFFSTVIIAIAAFFTLCWWLISKWTIDSNDEGDPKAVHPQTENIEETETAKPASSD